MSFNHRMRALLDRIERVNHDLARAAEHMAELEREALLLAKDELGNRAAVELAHSIEPASASPEPEA